MTAQALPGNIVDNRIVQTFSAAVVASSAPTVVGVSNATADYSTFSSASLGLINLRTNGASAAVLLLMDGVGAAGAINSTVYGLTEEASQNGNIVIDPHHICDLVWTLGATVPPGYTGAGSVLMANAVTCASTGVVDVQTLGIAPAKWPLAGYGGTLQGRAGVCIPRAGIYTNLLVAVWHGSGATSAFPKHVISVTV